VIGIGAMPLAVILCIAGALSIGHRDALSGVLRELVEAAALRDPGLPRLRNAVLWAGARTTALGLALCFLLVTPRF